MLSLVVTIGVFWGLKLVGIAMAGEAFCGREEHTHTAECMVRTLNCTREHEHTDDCYLVTYRCGLEEHTHTALCYANAAADVETAAEWEATLPTRTGNAGDDMAAIARSQVGYAESVQNFVLNDDGTRRGYTRYGAWYGNPHGNWSAMFVSFCLNYAGLPKDAAPFGSGTQTMMLEWTKAGLFAAADVVPAAGDVVFLDCDGAGKCTDVGVVDAAAETISVILGDCDDQVAVRAFAADDAAILGYGRVAEAAKAAADAAPVQHPVRAPAANSNSGSFEIVPSADTSKLIDVNLYDYGNNINDLFNQDKKYPGFQNPGGTKAIYSQISAYSMNFGDNVTSDYDAGLSSVTNKTHPPYNINSTTYENTANQPISGVLKDQLVNGYPALADGTSLGYLFSNSTYATKKNTASINGLFQYNPTTGEYYYNSHNNHAQFSASNNTFTLYKQTITSNFIMYPFGNFLPFNDIKSEATQVTSIDSGYFTRVAASARNKYNSNGKNEYKVLADVLESKFIPLMNAEGSWNYKTLLNKYFQLSSSANAKNNVSFPASYDETQKPLNNMYNIDYDNPTDFFFGMNMHMEFMQPKDGLTGPDGKQQMIYYFTGDDDVWIFIDGKLFLDLSGIHRHVGGKIDFVEGKVYYYALDLSKGDVSDDAYKIVTFEQILGSKDGLNDKGTFVNYSEHTLDFYYMERGSGSSVCRMNFNLPLLQKNRISVTKQLDKNLDDALGNPAFRFQVYKEGGQELLIAPGTPYNICDETGKVLSTGTTDANGIFTIHAGETAVFANIPENSGRYFVRELIEESIASQYGEVHVSGTTETVNAQNVKIGEDSFQSYDSPVKDMSDGSTAFRFTNDVDVTKYGRLVIEKQVSDDSETPADRVFSFTLTIDGTPIPAGTKITRTDADGARTESEITEAGKLTLHPGQRIEIANILAGARVQLTEDASSAAGYTVTYTGENIRLADADGGVSGVIRADGASQITVLNERNGTKLRIPVQKTLQYPDGTEKTFEFVLREVSSPENPTPVENGKFRRASVTMTDGTQDFAFTLNYPPETAAGTYYYRIREENGALPGADSGSYVVEVIVTAADGRVDAKIGSIVKNGSELAESVSFTNRNVRALTISKTVKRVENCTAKFEFTIDATVDGAPLAGTFACTGVDGVSEVTFTDGRAVIELADGESVTISDLPYGTVWTVTETPAQSFFTECGRGGETSSGSAIDGTLTADDHVAFVNVGGYELPATGSSGELICIVVGSALMLGALIGAIRLRRKKPRAR